MLLDWDEAADLLDLWEKLGDRPEWLKIEWFAFRDGHGELLVNIRGKRYWFPMPPIVYNRFLRLAHSVNRGVALQYIRKFIRMYKGYRGIWTRDYFRKNQIPGTGKPVRPWDAGARVKPKLPAIGAAKKKKVEPIKAPPKGKPTKTPPKKEPPTKGRPPRPGPRRTR